MNNKKPVCQIKFLLYGLLAFFMFSVPCLIKADSTPRIALIIDDMGLSYELGQSALRLSGAVTYYFLSNAPYAHKLAASAHKQGKQLMLHAPMQAIAKSEREIGELNTQMSAQVFSQLFVRQLNSIPNIAGVNNHKGSLLTQDYQSMARLMSLIKQQAGTDLFFVDSKTAQNSIAERVAKEFGLAVLARDVFLDHDSPSKEEIRRQFNRLIRIAQEEGRALAIAHPRINTLKILQEELAQLDNYGVRLVSVSDLMEKPQKVIAKRSFRSIPIKPKVMQSAEEFDVF
jgi:polysaccharide deacetylase 2 family uncharacterized protein YibQ